MTDKLHELPAFQNLVSFNSNPFRLRQLISISLVVGIRKNCELKTVKLIDSRQNHAEEVDDYIEKMN
jgi:hypothetical protein